MTRHEHDGHGRQRDDALRARLAGLDPTRPGGPAFAADPTTDDVEERIMSTTQQPATTQDQHGRGDSARWRRAGQTRWLAAAAALVLVAAGITGVLVVRDAHRTISTYPPRSVALTAPGAGGAGTSSCIQFDVEFLRDMPVAFAATVTAVTDQQVTLSVDRWYHGTAGQQRASIVTISLPGATTSVALDGVEFTQGKQYLVTATNGTVNGCGFSGPADPQLKAAYEQAFGN